MKLRNRMLSILLAVVLVLGMAPVGVRATEEPDALTARWTDAPAGENAIIARETRGSVGNLEVEDVEAISKPYADDELVDVIVVLKDEGLLETAGAELTDYTQSEAGLAQTQRMLKQHDSLRTQIAALSSQVQAAGIGSRQMRSFDYTAVLNGFSVRIPYGILPQVQKLAGVKAAFVAASYALPQDMGSAMEPMMDSSSGMIGAPEAWDLGYDGAGMAVAIIDSGLDCSHEAFANVPAVVKYTQDEVQKRMGKLSCGVTDASLTYVSGKIPFAYNYCDGSTEEIWGEDSHGTHVAGTIAGDCENLKGIAPKAQLMIMRVFNDEGSTSDTFVLAALDDAVKLGVDSINMSLGATSGFSYYWDETYESIYNAVEDAGINLLAAAGNEDNSTVQNAFGNGHPLASEPDSAMVAMPSTYHAPLSVASVENVEYYTQYFMVGSERFSYTNTMLYDTREEIDILDTFDGKTVDFVEVPNFGAAEDFAGLDLTGKIAVISRGGGLTFEEKLNHAAEAGATAAIVYSNAPGAATGMAVNNLTIPGVYITMADGARLLEQQIRKVSFSKEYFGKAASPDANQISDFSCWGPGNELTIKPEISAPGGNIYSSVVGGQYAVYSGTSMATPHMSAAAALVRQHLQKNQNLSGKELGDMVTNLMMGTAQIGIDQNTGLPFSPRRQGAGMVNLERALTTEAYVTVDGCYRPKAELGSDEDGAFTFGLTVHSWADHELHYAVDTDILTEAILEQYDLYFAAEQEQDISQYFRLSYQGLDENGILTVPAGGTANVTVQMEMTLDGWMELETYFENGCYVEGYVSLLTQDKQGVDLHVPYLGFYGDWENLPMVEDLSDGIYNVAPTLLMNANDQNRAYYLGYNAVSEAFRFDKRAFSSIVNGENRKLISKVSLLRNCNGLRASVTDQDGNELWTWDGGDEVFRKAFYYPQAGGIITTTLTNGWNGKLANGEPAPQGQYTYTISARPTGDGDVAFQDYCFDFYLDTTLPTVSDPTVYERDGATYLSVKVWDNHFVQYLMLCDSAHDYYYNVAAEEFDDVEKMGQTTEVVFNITDLAQTLSESGRNPGRLCLQTVDFANNVSYTFVDIGPQNMSVESADLDVGQTKKLSVTILPERMAGEKLTWASSDESICTVTQEGVVKGVTVGTATVSVKVRSGYTAYATIRVGLGGGDPESRSFGECAELNETFSYDHLRYKVSGPGTLILLGRDQTSNETPKDVIIPTSISYKGKDWFVTTIGRRAFLSDRNLNSIVIPNSVKTIGTRAFWNCTWLKSITLPDSIEYICDRAFYSVDGAMGLRIPAKVKYIGNGAFEWSNLETACLPDTLIEIGNEAFMNCMDLREAKIPDSVKTLGTGIFMECKNLEYAELPNGMTEIPQNMFFHCLALKDISIPYGVTVIGKGAFSTSGLRRLSLPSTVTTIESFAYDQLRNMKHIVIPESVTTIGTEAFGYCRNVESVTIGSNVNRIGYDAFYLWHLNEDGQWQDAAVPDVKSQQAGIALRRSGYTGKITLNGMPFTAYSGTSFQVGEFVYRLISDHEVAVTQFFASSAGEDVVIPATVTCEGDGQTYAVTEIGDRVFYMREDINSITLPDTIQVVGDGAMCNVSYLASLTVPHSLTRVGDFGFGNAGAALDAPEWTGPDTLVIPGTLRDWGVTTFGGYKAKTLIVEEGVTELGHSAFSGMTNVTNAVLPVSLKRMGGQSMFHLYNLTELSLPEGLEYIGETALSATPIQNLEIPTSVSFIGDQAFNGTKWDPDVWDEEEEEYGNYVYCGPETIRLGGGLQFLGFDSIHESAQVTVVLNSQRNMVIERNTVTQMPHVCWDGKTSIGYDDGSVVPADETVTVDGNVTIDGKLTVEGKLVVPHGVKLTITEHAQIVNPENIIYEGCQHTHTERQGEQEATCTEDGYTGNLVCTDCGIILEEGQMIPASCPTKEYIDLDSAKWYHEYTDHVIGSGLMNGVGEGRFAPNGSLTRGMLVTTLYRMAGAPEVQESVCFEDVTDGRYFTKAVAWARESGIAQGMTTTQFAPDAAVTREQAAVFLYRYVTEYQKQEPVVGGDLSWFTDSNLISDYAQNAMAWATAAGLLEGFGNGMVGPKETLTRAQMAKLLTILDCNF